MRELRPGPRHFTDLIEGLPGISRKLLTERLRDLERDGIIERTQLPPPAARQVYGLTADGRDLATAMVPLISWGTRRLGERSSEDNFRARWSGVAMASLADRSAAKGVRESYQYVVGNIAFQLVVDDGSIDVRDGRADDPSLVVTTDERTWADVAAGKTTVSAVAASGALTVVGDRDAAKRAAKIFSLHNMLSGTHVTAAAGP